MSQDVSSKSQVILKREEEIQGQQIVMSQVSQVNLWNDIKERFGDSSKEDKSPYNGESGRILEILETLETTIASKPVEDLPTRDIPGTVLETKTIEDELLQAEETRAEREKHFQTPPKKLKSYSEMVQLVPTEYASEIEEKLCKAFRGLLARGIAPRVDMMVKETGLDKNWVEWYLEETPWIRRDDSSQSGLIVYLPREAEA